MRINFDLELKTLDGQPVVEPAPTADDPQAVRPVTARSIAVNALLGEYRDDRSDGEEKLRRFSLARRINAGGDVEIKAEEVSLVKRLVGLAYPPLAVGQVYELLEG